MPKNIQRRNDAYPEEESYQVFNMPYNEGLKLFRAGDYGGALEEFQKELEDNQEDSK